MVVSAPQSAHQIWTPLQNYGLHHLVTSVIARSRQVLGAIVSALVFTRARPLPPQSTKQLHALCQHVGPNHLGLG